MKKNLAIFSTDRQGRNLTSLLDEMADKGYDMLILACEHDLYKKNKEKNWRSINLPHWLNKRSSLTSGLFIILSPLVFIAALITVIVLKQKYGREKIICLGLWEKVYISPLAKLLRLDPVWIEFPGNNYRNHNAVMRLLLRLSAKHARIIVFNDFTKHALVQARIGKAGYYRIDPAINSSDYRMQDNIFSQLAENGQKARQRKFFTIGTVARFDENHKLERLFQAGKKCLSVIPDLQIIIMGGSADKKNLMWLAKKMGIENMVWFVGEQQMLQKWFDNMDIYIDTSSQISLDSILIIVRSMASGLPVICKKDQGLDELVEDCISGLLLEKDDSDSLAQGIIRLHQNQELRKRINRQAREIAARRFTTTKQAEDFITVLNS